MIEINVDVIHNIWIARLKQKMNAKIIANGKTILAKESSVKI